MQGRHGSPAFGMLMLMMVGFFMLFPALKPNWLQIHAGQNRWHHDQSLWDDEPTLPSRQASWKLPAPTRTSRPPTRAEAAFDRGTLHFERQEWDQAIKEFDEVLRLDPKSADAFFNRGAAKIRKEQLPAALADYDAVLRLRPRDVYALVVRAEIRADLGEPKAALADLDEALRLDPENVKVFCTRGKVRENTGEYRLALVDYEQAVRRGSDNVEALNCLAWLLATIPDASLRDGRRAVEAALRAVELEDAKEWDTIDTLSAAFAESGRFAEAVRSQNAALRLAPAEEHDDLKARLDLYQAKQPYRLPEKSP